MDLGALQALAATALSGHTASEMWEQDKRFDVTVHLPVAARQSVDAIKRLRILLEDGPLVPLKALADISIDASRAAISSLVLGQSPPPRAALY